MNGGTISRRALLVQQLEDTPIYVFALTADELDQVAEISRVGRDDSGELIGYQRSEVRQHVDEIVAYLDGEAPIFPNAIILSLSSRCRFTRSRGPGVDDGVVAAGTLEIPLPAEGEPKPGWIVDGQQRSLALARSANRSFPVPVTAFVADTVHLQREQFLLVNSARPLSASLVTELLPKISAPITPRLAMKKIPSALVDELNRQEESPFHGLIKRPSARSPQAVVTDTALVKPLTQALRSPHSFLFPYRNVATNETDVDGIWKVLISYWSGVRLAFPEAWGLPAAKSRLMHGVGIQSMSGLLDRVMPMVDTEADDAADQVAEQLGPIVPHCAWTSGTWDLGEAGTRRWNELQNTPSDVKLLTQALTQWYLHAKATR